MSDPSPVERHHKMVIELTEDFQTLCVKKGGTALDLFQACALLMQAQVKGGHVKPDVALAMLKQAVELVDWLESEGTMRDIPTRNCPPSEDLS